MRCRILNQSAKLKNYNNKNQVVRNLIFKLDLHQLIKIKVACFKIILK